MADLPFLQSYNDPRIQKAYERCQAGESLRSISKALRIPLRTLARRSKEDGWVEERKARIAATESPNVATAATAVATADVPPPALSGAPETRHVGMERVLGRQQRITGILVDAYERDVTATLASVDPGGKLKPVTRSQIAQLTMLGNNLMTMERKAWCVPDKIETKDTTPVKPDPIREMTDEQLDRELAEAAERARTSAPAGTAAEGRVN